MSSSKTITDDPTRSDAEGAGPEAAEESEQRLQRPDRNVHRAAMTDLKDLANRLAKLPPSVRRTLPLDAELLAELERLATAAQMPHRRRLLMRVKLLLGAEDLEKLGAVLEGDTDAAALHRVLQRWRVRILEGDDTVIQAFMEAYPAADRQGIRTAVRDARRTGPVAARAATRLLHLLRAAAAATSAEAAEAAAADEDDALGDAAEE